MKYHYLLLIVLAFLSCKEPQARKPVSVKSGHFLKNSVERTKKRLQQEHTHILNYIANDSTSVYHNSNLGFWYSYITQDSLANTPKFGDKITYTYSVSDLNNTPVYSTDDIGEQTYYIDQQDDIIEGFRQGLKLIRKNETIKYIFPSQLAYGYRGDGHKININTPIVCTVQLHDILTKTN
ncbi:MAG: gliding motility-associated peptidyl-prolyl isomerase GldI [Flavobacteriaceae bacterium]